MRLYLCIVFLYVSRFEVQGDSSPHVDEIPERKPENLTSEIQQKDQFLQLEVLLTNESMDNLTDRLDKIINVAKNHLEIQISDEEILLPNNEEIIERAANVTLDEHKIQITENDAVNRTEKLQYINIIKSEHQTSGEEDEPVNEKTNVFEKFKTVSITTTDKTESKASDIQTLPINENDTLESLTPKLGINTTSSIPSKIDDKSRKEKRESHSRKDGSETFQMNPYYNTHFSNPRCEMSPDEVCATFHNSSKQCKGYDPAFIADYTDCYCERETVKGSGYLSYCCDFQGHEIYLTKTRELDSILIRNSSILVVDLHYAAHYVVIDHVTSAQFNYVEGAEATTSISFRASNSGLIHLPNFHAYALTNCTVQTIDNVHNLVALEANNSHIAKLKNLISYSYGGRDTAMCFGTRPTALQSLQEISRVFPVTLRNCTIGTIENCYISEVLVHDTRIHTLLPAALILKEGNLDFSNVIIDNMYRDAIVVVDSAVALRNVIIKHCDEPCFKFPRKKFQYRNVTINGVVLCPETIDRFLPSDETAIHVHNSTYCIQKFKYVKNVAVCDLESLAENHLQIVLSKYTATDEVIVSNHHNIDIVEGCSLMVRLRNISGFYEDLSCSSRRICDGSAGIHLQQTSLKTLFSQYIGDLQADEGISRIGNVHLENLHNLNTENLQIDFLNSVIYEAVKKTDHFVYKNGLINVIHSLKLFSPAEFNNVSIANIENLEVNIDYKEAVKIVNSSIFHVNRNGIRVVQGTLKLDGVDFTNIVPGMIHIEKHGYLHIGTIEGNTEFKCLEPAISALYLHQVIHENLPMPNWLWNCISIRYEERTGDLGAEWGYTPLDPAQCRTVETFSLVCNAKNMPKNLLVGGLNPLDDYQALTVSHTSNLTIETHCLKEITLIHVNHPSIIGKKYSCFYSLRLFDSKIDVLDRNIYALYSLRSYIEKINQRRGEIHRMTVGNTIVQTLVAFVKTGNLTETIINHLDYLYITKSFIISGSEIGNVAPHAITIEPEAFVVVQQSNILQFQESAVKVFGNLTLHYGSTFNFEGKESIRVENSGKLIIRNCAIKALKVSSLVIYGSLIMENVVITEAAVASIILGPKSSFQINNIYVKDCANRIFIYENGSFPSAFDTSDEDCTPVYNELLREKPPIAFKNDSCTYNMLRECADTSRHPLMFALSIVLIVLVGSFIIFSVYCAWRVIVNFANVPEDESFELPEAQPLGAEHGRVRISPAKPGAKVTVL